MTLAYVKAAKAKGYLKIGIEDLGKRYDFVVSEKDFLTAGGPSVGDNLTRNTFEHLSYSDMEYKAKAKALHILSFGDNSERMLVNKLCAKGISRDAAQRATAEMVRLGYINTSRQLELLITNEVRLHNSGPRKIAQKLVAKGYNAKDISKKISELEGSGEIDFNLARQRLIKARLGDTEDREEIKKLLYKNGYFI